MILANLLNECKHAVFAINTLAGCTYGVTSSREIHTLKLSAVSYRLSLFKSNKGAYIDVFSPN